MAVQKLWAAALALCGLLAIVGGDDEAWTRARWGTAPYKLPLPRAALEAALPPAPAGAVSSLGGPRPRGAAGAPAPPAAAGAPPSSPSPSADDDDWARDMADLAAAAGALACDACRAVVREGWRLGAAFAVLDGRAPPAPRLLRGLRGACAGAATEGALEGAALQRSPGGEWARVARAAGAPPGAQERVAARLACAALLRSPARGTAPPALTALMDALRVYSDKVRAATGGARPAAPVGGACADAHPECPRWAAGAGDHVHSECERNPDYMLTRCRLSCGLCAPAVEAAGTLAARDSLARDADGLAAGAMLTACIRAPPCGGGKAQQGTAAPAPAPATSSSASSSPFGALAGRCFVVPAGWWVYEVCVGGAVRQVHLPAGPADEPAENVLGRWAPAAAPPAGTPRPLLRLGDLYAGAPAGGPPVPYAPFAHAGGDPCVGAPDALPTPRTAELRLACPHDGRTRATVVEPAPCAYVLTLFHADACALPGLAPPDEGEAEGGAAGADAAADSASTTVALAEGEPTAAVELAVAEGAVVAGGGGGGRGEL